ncbi:MAG: hypothetical protein ACPG47_07225, partial [Leucothrix sp.]
KTLLNQMPFNVPELFIDHHHWSRRHAGIIAIKASESQWHINIPYQEAPLIISVPMDQAVIGIHRRHTIHKAPALVCVNQYDYQTFSFVGEHFQEVCCTLTEPCISAELNPNKPLLHYQTHQGLLKTIPLGSDEAITAMDLMA